MFVLIALLELIKLNGFINIYDLFKGVADFCIIAVIDHFNKASNSWPITTYV